MKKLEFKTLLTSIATISLVACSVTRETPAPIVNVTRPPINIANNSSTSNDTVVTKINPAAEGVVENNTQNHQQVVISNNESSQNALVKPASNLVALKGIGWQVPVKGSILNGYSVASKGIDISANEGQNILAAQGGRVVYSGHGLQGYGNLIIIKHQDNYLTAYAHNKVNLVSEGDNVTQGEKIAEVGKTDSQTPMLHFELRQNGKPINPTTLFVN